MTTKTFPEHLHAGALAALLGREPRSKSEVARSLGMTPGNLRELETGIRPGTTVRTRERIAAEFEIQPRQVTCWCDRPHGLCRSVPS